MSDNEVSKDVLLDGAQMWIAAMWAAMAGFLKERNVPLRDFVQYLGESFEGSFGALEGRGADEVMEHLITLEVLPTGAEVVSKDMNAERAEVTLTSLPPGPVLEKFGTTPRELLRGFGVTSKEYESIYAMYTPAAKAIGLKFKHEQKGGQEVLVLERPPARRNSRPKVG